MARTLIIGYGNPLRGDDGVGWHAAQRLAVVFQQTDAEIIACHQLTPELAEPMSRAELVVFIDAEQCDAPGRLSCQVIRPETSPPSTLSHHLAPANLLAWAQELYGSCPEGVLFSVSGQSFGCSEELSAAAAAALPELIERICSLVAAGKRADLSAD